MPTNGCSRSCRLALDLFRRGIHEGNETAEGVGDVNRIALINRFRRFFVHVPGHLGVRYSLIVEVSGRAS